MGFEMRYKLPMGVTGDKVMLQWRYVTGNSCMSPGYCCHDDDDYFDLYQNVSSWKRANAALCTYPLDPTGATGTGKPELFWNCAEITILPSNGQPTTPSPVITPPTPAPIQAPTTTTPTISSPGCCTIDFKSCSATVVGWCSESRENCEGPCDKWWLPNGAINGCNARYESCTIDSDCCSPGVCVGDSNGYKSCQAPAETSPPTPEPSSNPEPTSPAPTAPQSEHLSCAENSMSSVTALSYMEDLTYTVSASPYTLTILAEGGAAGSGGSVVSEGQGYGLLTSAIALASLEVSDPNRNDVMNKFYGYFNGWRTMCVNSSPSPCQSPQYCTHDGGKAPCLPGWKHKGDLSVVEGTGAAPDGDEDAILGMIIAIKAIEKDQNPSNYPIWYDELHQWTDESITQFLADNTVLSSSSSHRLLKLGSCWGGWNSEGNNPSYPAPGAFRAMRDFHVTYDGPRNYVMPTFGDSLNIEDKWNMLIDTSYKFYGTTQCADTGLVPNWALVKEADSENLAKQSGSFSGSGTPQHEFGAEASRTMWRVALDAILYPAEASASSEFLKPIHQKLYEGFDDGVSDWSENTLQTCSYVNSIFSSWKYNGFMFGPVYSTLAVQANSMTTSEQQKLVNVACQRVGNIPNSGTYYAKSWQVISMMTLNGDASKIGALLRGSELTSPPSPISSPTTQGPTLSPTLGAPTLSPTPPTATDYCCSFDYKTCGSDPYCNNDASSCSSCNGQWIEDSPKTCKALWQQCDGGSSTECCGPAACVGEAEYSQCQPQTSTPAPVTSTVKPTSSPVTTPNPVFTPSPVASPTKVSTFKPIAPTSSPVTTTNPTKSPTLAPITPSPVANPTNAPTLKPIAPTSSPTKSPVSMPTYCCSWGGNVCTNLSDSYCHGNQSNCEGNCSGKWIDPNAPTQAPAAGCCSWNKQDCQQLDNTWCQEKTNCESACSGTWLTR